MIEGKGLAVLKEKADALAQTKMRSTNCLDVNRQITCHGKSKSVAERKK